MRIHKRVLFLFFSYLLLFNSPQLQAQDDNDNSGSSNESESKEERVSRLLKELLEFRIAKDALRIYNLTNVDKSWTPNGELRDSIIGFRNLAGINFMLRDTMAYDHFWSFICNGGGYKTPDGASEGSAEARFKIQFKPDWDTTQEAPPQKALSGNIVLKFTLQYQITTISTKQTLKKLQTNPSLIQSYRLQTNRTMRITGRL